MREREADQPSHADGSPNEYLIPPAESKPLSCDVSHSGASYIGDRGIADRGSRRDSPMVRDPRSPIREVYLRLGLDCCSNQLMGPQFSRLASTGLFERRRSGRCFASRNSSTERSKKIC